MKAVNACRRFFRAAEEVFQGVGPRRMEQMNLIAAVVDDDIRMMVQRFVEEIEIFFLCRAIPGIDCQAVFYESCGDVVLRRQGIASRDDDVGAGPVQDFGQVRRFSFQMDADADRLAFKGLFFS